MNAPMDRETKLRGIALLVAFAVAGAGTWGYMLWREQATAKRLCEYAAMMATGASYAGFDATSGIMEVGGRHIMAKVSYTALDARDRPGRGIATCDFLRDGLQDDPNLFDFNLLGARLDPVEIEYLRMMVRTHGSHR